MAGVDVTALSISVTSHGVQDAANALKALSEAATLVEGKTKTIKEATSGLSSSQQASVANIEKLIAGFQKQADLVGANVSQINAYTTAMKGGTKLEQEMAMMLGAEVDAYRAKSVAQAKAIADNNALDASYKKLQQEADAFYASQAKAQAAGNALNATGQREQELKKITEAQRELTRQTNELAAADARQKSIQQSRDIELRTMSYQKLTAAQAEALAINKALDAATSQQKAIQQARDVELHAMSYQKLAAAQAEAIKMNNAYDASLRRLNQDEAAKKQSMFNNTMQQGHDLARGLSGSLGALWLTYGNIGMMIAGVAIGASLKEAVTGFAKVEYQMTFVKALAEDTTHSVAELTARMHDVAGALGIAPEAAAKGLRALTQAGLSTTDALSTLPVAFKLATVGELALESAALAATGVMNAYDLKVQNLEHIGDVMAKAGAMSAASVDSISVSMKYSAGTAEQYGVSLEKLGSILTLLGKRGITGSSAGVAANNLIAELYSPSSEKAIKAAAALGVKAYVDGVRQPIEDVVQSFKTGLAKFDAEGQGMLLEAMFGKKGGKAMYAIAGATKQEFKDLETQLVNSTGFVADVYKANLKTVEGQLNLTKSAITNMFAKVGEESSAPIKELLISIRSIASSQAAQDMFVGLTQSIKTFITTVVPAAIAVGGFFAAAKVGTVVVAGWTAAMAFLESTIAIGLIPTIKALNIAMLANPIGLLIGLVSTLAAGYFLLKRNKESVHDLHQTDMAHAAETLKAGNDEIAMLQKQLTLRGQNIRGDGEQAAIKEMQANEAVMKIRDRIMENNTKYYEALGKSKNAGSFNASGPKENIQLQKDLDEATKTYKQLSDQNKSINDLKKRLREEDKRMDAEDLANATPKVIGNQKYNGNEKGLKSAASDAYAAAIAKEHDIIKASKMAMQNFEETQNNLFKAGEIGKLKFIQDVGNKQVEELTKQHTAIEAQLKAAEGKKNGKADTQKFTDDLVANELAAKTVKIKTAEETNVQLAQYAQDNTRFQIAELETQGKFGAAAALKFSSENKLAFKQAEQDIADFGDKFPIITERFKQLGAARDAAVSAGNEKEALASFMNLAEATRNALKGIQTASEGLGLGAMLDAASAATATLTGNMEELRARMGKLTDQKDINEAQAQLTNLAETQRKLWAGVGESIKNSLKDAFGSSGQAIGEMLMVSINTGNVETKLAADKAAAIKKAESAYKAFGFSQFDTAKALDKINLEYTEKEKGAKLKSYADMAGAAKGFFKEGTTGYKAMEAAQKVLTIVSLIESAKRFMAFAAENVPLMITVGAIALLSGFLGGSQVDPKMLPEYKQKVQGTGSVLGSSDAKSESIVNSLGVLEKNSGLGLAHSTTMIHYLKNVSDNIAGLASALLVKAGVDITKGPADYVNGGTIGKISNSIFGGNKTTLDTGIALSKDSLQNTLAGSMNSVSYSQTKEDGGWFSSDKYRTEMKSLGTETNSQFTKIIQNMTDSIKAAADDLGMGGDAFTAHLNTFIVDIGAISAKGLTGTEVQKALEAAFSKLGDDMAKFAIVGLDKFQKVGEGYLETVMRVANDTIQVRDVFAVLGKTFNLTGIAAVNVSESLITAVGGLDKLGSGAQFFVDNFLSEAEKMGPITASVREQMAALHYGNVTTIEDFSKLVRSLDLTDPASQALYGSLMDIAPQFLEAANYATKLADGTVTLTKAQQKALDAVTKAKTQLQDSYNAESSALQGTIDKTKTFISTLKNYQDSLKLGADSPLTNMQKYAEARKQFDATAAAANGGDQAAKDKFTSASSALLAASKTINASGDAYTSDFNMVQSAIDTLMGSAGTQVDVAQASLDALNASVSGLMDINKSVMSVTDAIKALQSAITLGGAAGLTNAQMDTTYTPTPAQVAAATPSASGSTTMPAPYQQIADGLGRIGAAIAKLREEQAAQTGAIVGATIQSNEDNADTIAEAVSSSGSNRSGSNKIVALV